MVEVIFSESAWQDLDSITDYIALDSPRFAQEFSDRIIHLVEQLTEFPHSGRVVPEFQNDDLRELIFGRYRIVYRLYGTEKAVIVRIIHGSKLLI